MDRSSSSLGPGGFQTRLTRRRALATAGASIATVGIANSNMRPGRASAQEATPVASLPPGRVTADSATRAVDQIPALAKEIMDKTGVPGMAVAAVFDDKVVYTGGFGVRELGQDVKIDEDTVFQLASVSKSVASTVVASVVADGKISWLTRMSDIDPAFALPDAWPTKEVSIADLFSHRAGLPDHAGDQLEDLGFSREYVIHALRYMSPEYSFRQGYGYTNFGLTAAAVAAAGTTGKTWEDLSDERLYQPLGMSSTSSRFSDYIGRANRAIPHQKTDTGWAVTTMQRQPDAQTPAGGVSSSARDLAQWLRLILLQGKFDGQQLIPTEALDPAHIPQARNSTPADPATQRAGFYGFGFNVSYDEFGEPRWSHSGGFLLGAGTAFYTLPASGFGVLALTNGSPFGTAEALCLSVLDLAQQGVVTRDWLSVIQPLFTAQLAATYGSGTKWDIPPASVTAALANEAYVGTYTNDIYGDVEIFNSADGLGMRVGPQPLEFVLNHYDHDTFYWQPIGENGPDPSGLTFTIGADGNATSFFDEYFEGDGDGTMTRKSG
jgi:CubicO group peptidase (beta-lactamase class C family)